MSSFANTKILVGLIESTQLMQASLQLFTPGDFDPTSTSQKDRQVQQAQKLQLELIRLIRDLQECKVLEHEFHVSFNGGNPSIPGIK